MPEPLHPARPPQPDLAETGIWRAGYWLVLALIVVSYALCAAQSSPDPSSGALLVQLVTVAAILRVARVSTRVQRAAQLVIAVSFIAVLAVWVLPAEGAGLDVALSATSMLAYLIAPAAIIGHQLRRAVIDAQTLLAAISAYILVGMFFTFVYNFTSLSSAASVFGSEPMDSLSTQLFFSFTTLTTTGYGNVVPAGPIGESIAIAEAVTGQLFLVVAVARVVTGWVPPRRGTDG